MLSALPDALVTQCSGRQDRNPKPPHPYRSLTWRVTPSRRRIARSRISPGSWRCRPRRMAPPNGVTRNYQTAMQSWGRDCEALRRPFPEFGKLGRMVRWQARINVTSDKEFNELPGLNAAGCLRPPRQPGQRRRPASMPATRAGAGWSSSWAAGSRGRQVPSSAAGFWWSGASGCVSGTGRRVLPGAAWSRCCGWRPSR